MEDVEKAILGLLRNREFFQRYDGVLKAEYFVDDYSRLIYEYISKYFTKYPDRKMASKRNLRLMVDLAGDDKRIVTDLIRVLSYREGDSDIIQDKIKEFVKRGIASNLIRSNIPALEGKEEFDIEQMMNDLQAAKDFELNGESLYDYVLETENFHKSYSEGGEPIATGIGGLDENLHFPPTTRELWMVLGPPGRGKTQWLLNILANAASQGKRGLYITAGDQGRVRVQQRLDTIISGIPYKKFKDPNARVMGLLRKRVRERIAKAGGRILIQDWSDTSCTPRQIEGCLQRLQGEVDLVGVDYPGIMRSNSKYQERRHEIASINNDLRKIAVRNGVLIWAGTQANRSALDKKTISMKDLAEDIQQAWVADGIIALCQTPEEKEEEFARLYICKARRPPLQRYEINVIINPETGRIEG